MKIPRFLSALAAIALFAPSTLSGGTFTQEVIETSTEAAPKDWNFTLGLYSWLPAMRGDVGIGRYSSKVNVGMDEVLKRLDIAYMGYAEARYRRFGLSVDALYSKLSDQADYHYGPFRGTMNFKLKQTLVTVRGLYRLVEDERYTLDLTAGFRWTSLSADVTNRGTLRFKPQLLQQFNRDFQRSAHRRQDWVDPIIGLRGLVNLSESWYLNLSGDIGGFGVSSRLTWQAMGGVGYRFNRNVSVFSAYRALGIDYDRKGLKLDTVSHGPLISLVFNF